MGESDIYVVMSIVAVFLIVGTVLPFFSSTLGTTELIENDATGLVNEIGQNQKTLSVNVLSVFISIASMFFWTFGALPWWLDIVFVIARVTLYLTIARNIWVGGGG